MLWPIMSVRSAFRIATLVFLLAATAAQGAFRMRCVTLQGVTSVFLEDVATFYGLTFSRSADDATLRSGAADLRFTLDRRQASVNGVAVHLNHAPALWNGHLVLSDADFRFVLDPILRGQTLPGGRPQRVMLDPGHGGKDRGASGRTVHEKNLNLALAKSIARVLRQQGLVVELTRNDDRDVSLAKRVAKAAEWRADLFISIHANSVGTASVRGIETFVLALAGSPITYGTTPRKHASDGNAFNRQNARLGFELQKHMVLASGGADRGLKRATFAVLRDAPCPAALVEVGFLSNPQEERLLGSAAYQARLVRGIALGILGTVNAFPLDP